VAPLHLAKCMHKDICKALCTETITLLDAVPVFVMI
jgi:hypothetical protein